MYQGSITKLFSKPKPKVWDFKIHATLCIHRTIDAGAMGSLINLLCWPNPKVEFSSTMGDALIERARSQEASDFLRKTDCDILLMIDDDVSYSASDAIEVCRNAYEKQEVVCGAYVVKREGITWITSKPLDEYPITFKPGGGLVEIRYGATGFMAIPRVVLQDLVDASNDYPEHHPNHLPLCHPTDLKFWPFFASFPQKNENNGDYIFLSEDWAFGQKLRNIGHKTYLNTSVRLQHSGRYNYSLDDLCRPLRQYCEVIQYTDKKDDVQKVPGEVTQGSITK